MLLESRFFPSHLTKVGVKEILLWKLDADPLFSSLSSYSLALCMKNLFFLVHIALVGLRMKTFYKEKFHRFRGDIKKYEKIRLRILCTSSSKTIGER